MWFYSPALLLSACLVPSVSALELYKVELRDRVKRSFLWPVESLLFTLFERKQAFFTQPLIPGCVHKSPCRFRTVGLVPPVPASSRPGVGAEEPIRLLLSLLL